MTKRQLKFLRSRLPWRTVRAARTASNRCLPTSSWACARSVCSCKAWTTIRRACRSARSLRLRLAWAWSGRAKAFWSCSRARSARSRPCFWRPRIRGSKRRSCGGRRPKCRWNGGVTSFLGKSAKAAWGPFSRAAIPTWGATSPSRFCSKSTGRPLTSCGASSRRPGSAASSSIQALCRFTSWARFRTAGPISR